MSTNIFSGITAEPSPSSGAFVGYNVIVQILGEDVAKADRISFRINNNIRDQYVIGSRTPLLIETGFAISGSIRSLYVNTGMLRLVLGNVPDQIPQLGTDITGSTVSGWMGNDITTPAFAKPDTYYRLPEMTISCILSSKDDANDRTQTIDLMGVKFDNMSVDISANDIILQDIDFLAQRIKPTVT